MVKDSCCHADHPEHGHSHHVRLDALQPPLATAGGVATSMRIVQMDCPTEEALIRKALGNLPDVHRLDFNLMQRVLTVHHAEHGLDAVVAALRDIGFQPELPDAGTGALSRDVPAPASRPWWPLALAGSLALAAEVLHWIQAPGWAGLILALAAIALSGLGTYKKGLVALRHRNLNINALMSIAVTGAVLLGQWPEAAMVMVLFAVAELIEARSLDRPRRAVDQLVDVAPRTVKVRMDDTQWADRDVRDVAIGETVRAMPGERIGLDGIVVSGRSDVDQAPITGESRPQDKQPGDPVYAGTINGMGELHYEVSAVADHTLLARIVHAIQDAQAQRAPTQRFVDRFAQVYTPIVCLVALAVAVLPPLLLAASWYDWIYRALVLLVIACPCALVISTPVAVVSALGAAARQGILVKGGVYLEQGRHLKWLALDKTGTLTTGKPVLLDVMAVQSDADVAQCHALAAALASRSDHPVSRAIAQGFASNRDTTGAVTDFTAVPGGGTWGTINGRAYYLGSSQWIATLPGAGAVPPHLQATLDSLRSQGKTVSVLADASRILALFVVADRLRDTTRDAIRDLHGLGVRTMMLSGDDVATARYIGGQAGIDDVAGGLLPQQKLAAIESLMARGMTGMVGDGINDAPALARADIGFAMGAVGTDTAIETADVALMDDDLRKVADFMRLSARTHRILVQNISCALGLKLVFLALTVAGMATMWMAVFADVGASLIVLANSLRLLRRPASRMAAPGRGAALARVADRASP